jgi:hypothetical protein
MMAEGELVAMATPTPLRERERDDSSASSKRESFVNVSSICEVFVFASIEFFHRTQRPCVCVCMYVCMYAAAG